MHKVLEKKEGNPKLPLSSYRVLNLTDEKGAFCGKILSDLGADVIKIEPPQGDKTRNVGPFFHNNPSSDKSLFWFAYYTNQRGITLNIETVDGQRIFKELVKTSDFIIESFAPGYLDKLGLGYSTLSQINPSIIMTSITPFGQEGPYKDWKASDIVVSAMGVLTSLVGDPDRAPLRIGGTEQSFLVASAYAAAGTMIAHYYRVISGRGQYVDVSAQESMLFTTMASYLYQEMQGICLRRAGYRFVYGKQPWRMVWPCKDGYVMWVILAGWLGRHTRRMVEWMDSEGQAGELKNINWEELDVAAVGKKLEHWESLFGKFFKTHTKTECEREAKARGFMLFAANTPKDLLENSQLAARNYWVKIDYPELAATITHPGAAYQSSGVVWGKQRRAPLLGEHNGEVYQKELGFSHEEVCQLKQANVI